MSVYKKIQQMIDEADLKSLGLIYRGLEKENMRIDSDGYIALTDHPRALGSALTNLWVTTDFSESLVEVVTPAVASLSQLKQDISAISQFCWVRLNKDELFWPASMPSCLNENDIRLAYYGKNNSGKMKQVYRHGLAERYGKTMQMIAGIHYNISFSQALFESLWRYDGKSCSLAEYTNQRYMGLVRNFFRYGWLLPYLFGASPIASGGSVSESFDFLQAQGQDYIGPYATSLRLSRLGYQNKGKHLMHISYNSVEEYASSILQATRTPYAPFSKLGICSKDKAGQRHYTQLNDALLQIENEYYSPMRPKQPAERCKRPVASLLEKGVCYIELRALDLNPFEPLGFEAGELEFVDLFLLFCLLEDSPVLSAAELADAELCLQQVAEYGRKPGLMLTIQGRQVSLQDAAERLFEALLPLAERLDAEQAQAQSYLTALNANYKKLTDISLIPSAKLLDEFLASGINYTEFMLKYACKHQDYWQQQAINPVDFQRFDDFAKRSLVEFENIEQAEQVPFEEYLARYFQQGDAKKVGQ
ncbi:glutamate--cysteine ligase [Piscirickettsia salmonis]|nr:glutamate--cysteine ligase [Piscirickettsia salmonis]QHS25457.1 glutamate--cysteine ligase [Piscirickettsia salmonis]QHS28657.1 glutamate--cysteine ligase [Piscirickettsia salmonis]